MSKQNIWGEITWIFLHTLACSDAIFPEPIIETLKTLDNIFATIFQINF